MAANILYVRDKHNNCVNHITWRKSQEGIYFHLRDTQGNILERASLTANELKDFIIQVNAIPILQDIQNISKNKYSKPSLIFDPCLLPTMASKLVQSFESYKHKADKYGVSIEDIYLAEFSFDPSKIVIIIITNNNSLRITMTPSKESQYAVHLELYDEDADETFDLSCTTVTGPFKTWEKGLDVAMDWIISNVL